MFPRVLVLIGETPAVFLLPLLLTTVAVLDGFPSGFVLTLAFVSTTPSRVALLLLLVLLAFLVFPVLALFVLSLPQPDQMLTTASRHKDANVRRMDPPSDKKIAA
jgi:hypothetical protein